MKSRYITIQEWMISELNLKGYELLVYAIIYGFSQDGESRYHGSLSYLGKWLQTSDQTLLNSLKSLYSKGLIQKQENYKGNRKYVEYWATEDRSKNLSADAKKTLADNAQKTLVNNKYKNTKGYIKKIPQPIYTNPDVEDDESERLELIKRYHSLS